MTLTDPYQMLSLAQRGFFPGSFFFHTFKFCSSQMRKGKINARVFLCFAFVYRVFEGWQDARSMNMMFDGGRGDGEHWCSCAGTLLWLQRAHMPILMWCPRFPLRLNWQSQRWHLCSCIRPETGRDDKKIKTCDCVCLVFVMLEGIYMYLGKVSHSMSHTLVHRGILKLMAPSFGC